MDPLDNIMWYSLRGAHAPLAEGNDLAKRFPLDVGPFAAVADEPRVEHYEALRALVGPGQVATLFRGDVETPRGWDILATIDALQMIGPTTPPSGPVDERIITLNADDAEEMLALTTKTKPGPFAARTHELGTYLGVRINHELVAMAGQRARTDEHVEISAVCTDDRYVGHGLGRALVQAQVATIVHDERIPMLQVSASNARALALYESMGFRPRRRVEVVILRSPS